jgi:hypothetical protein
LHVHAPKTLTPTATEYELTGQPTHAAAAVAPTVTRYVPAEQSEHPTEPLAALYFPATQAVHVPLIASFMSAYVNPALQVQAPAAELELGAFEFEGQAEQALEPATEYEFTPQPTHAAAAVAPTVTEYVPAPQSEQTALPTPVLYFPATHNAHAPAGPVLPAAQSYRHAVLAAAETPPAAHAVHALAPAVAENVPAAQSVHAASPLLVLYFPATHNAHVPGSPVLPAGQGPVTQTLAPAVDVKNAGHVVHEDALGMVVYLPAEQDTHVPGDTNGMTSANERYPPYWYKYKYRPLTTWSQVTVNHTGSYTFVIGLLTCDLHILFSGEFQARPSPIAKYQLLES